MGGLIASVVNDFCEHVGDNEHRCNPLSIREDDIGFLIFSYTSLLDIKNRALFNQANDEQAALRVVCDYIANMTDEYAYRMHERLFGFNTRTIFERL